MYRYDAMFVEGVTISQGLGVAKSSRGSGDFCQGDRMKALNC